MNTKGTLLFQDWTYTSISGQYETLLHYNYWQYCGSISSIVLVLTYYLLHWDLSFATLLFKGHLHSEDIKFVPGKMFTQFSCICYLY